MARRRKGYQEGIDVPTTLGAPLASWSDPTPTPTKSFDLRVPNTGAQRDYGATGAYVDTVPHRWKVGQPTLTGKQAGQLVQSRAQDRASAADLGISPGELRARRRTARATGARDARLSRDRALFDTTAEDDLRRSATDLGVTPGELTTWRREDAETRRREEVLSRDRDIAMRRPPAGPGLGGPAPTAFPSPTGTGTPPADSLEEPDISTAGDPFIVGIRGASDEPLDSPVEWRDDPDMPSLGLPGGAGDRALEDWLRGGGDGSSRTPASKPPSSRTQRRPRRPNA